MQYIQYPKVSVIIVNYNGEEDTLECLKSLQAIDYPVYKIIVVDNASKDAGSLLNKIYGQYNAKIFALAQNFGFAGGCNVGINYALKEQQADYVLLLNNDTLVAQNFLTEMVKAGESDKKIGIVGAKIYYHDEPRKIWYNGGRITWTDGGKHEEYDQIDNQLDGARIKPTDFVTGCALLIKAEAIASIGLLDESFFMYGEDIDWCLRAKKSGYKLVVATAAHVRHKISRSASQIGKPKIHYYHIRNSLLLAKKHALPIILGLVYLWCLWHYFKQMVKMALLPSKREISKMIMRGIEDFYKRNFGQIQT